MSEKAKLEIDIQAPNAKVLSEVEQRLDKLEAKGKASGSSLAKSFVVLGGIFAGVSAAVGKTVAEFSTSEEASAKLAQALKNTGNYSAAAMEDLNNYATALQQTTKFEDDSIIAAQSLIAAQGFHGKVLKDLTQATLDLATAKGMDLSSAADILAKSVGTENNVLARYGIEIRGAADSTDRAYSAVKAISDLYGGQAAAAGRTFSGQMESLKNQIGNVAEDIGGVLAPVLLELNKIFRDAVVFVGRFITEHKGLSAAIIGGVAGFTGLAAAVSGVLLILPALGAAFAVITSPVGLIIGGIIAIIAAFENWGAISEWLKGVWANALNVLATMWEICKNKIIEIVDGLIILLQDFGTIAWDIFTGKWKEALDLAQEHIAGFSEAGAQTFSDLFTSVSDGMVSFADGAVNIYDGIKNKVSSIIGNIQSAWKNGLTKNTSDTVATGTQQMAFWNQHWTQLLLGKQLNAKAQQDVDQSVANTFGMMATLRNSKTRELFEIGKALAIASAIVMGIQGALAAITSTAGLGPVGWVLGAAMAATIAGITAYNVSQIAGTDMPAAEFGGIIPGSSSGMPVLAGERNKSEAIIPLEGEGADRLRGAMGGGGNTIIVNVENMWADDRESGRKVARIVDEELENLRQNRRSAFAHGLIGQVAIG